MTKKHLCAAASAALLACAWGALGQETRLAARELVDLSLEQLSNIVVHSVSRRDEPLARAPASVYVISAEDIRRSGATSLPDALRLAPNLMVARADANQYAISARGFNQVLANKMLVLIDGRTIYTPLFSGANSLASVLQSMGHEVRVEHDGEAGLSAAQAFRPELAFLDIGMPKLNGYDLAAQLRAHPMTAATTLVAVTGWGQATDLQRARDAGFDEHMVKPVEMDRLEALLRG